MNRFSKFDLRQRYNFALLTTLAIASYLLILCLYLAIKSYANDYTSHYWQEHTGIFSDSIQYSVTMGAKARSETIANNFANDKNVLKAAIYNSQQALLATAGKPIDCNKGQHSFAQPFFIEANDYWCFYAPVYQDSPAGAFEQKLAGAQATNYLGYVELVVSKAEMTGLLHQILTVSGLIVGLILVVIYFVVRRFSGNFTEPMVEMVAVLKNVAQGIPGGRVSFTGAPDIVSMGDTFNEMLARIEINEQILEQKIEDRTFELKTALDRSEAANDYKTHIIATVSHEMKTPLHAISAYLELIHNSLPEGTDYDLCRDFHRRAMTRTGELNELIGNILLHGKLTANKVDIVPASLTLQTLINECIDKITPVLQRNRNRINILGQNISIVSDAEVVKHIINNLLSNAGKFTLEGDIIVNWWKEHSVLVLQVSDTGCGIPKQFHQKIFDSFWQVDMSMTREYGGTGLGLAITKQFVDLLGGEISVNSNVGKGSVFTVRIPSQSG
jgi:signal transduction histidine kinase